ncbi:hypothetical protein EPUL_002106, partial [Erysiphe pulchra]
MAYAPGPYKVSQQQYGSAPQRYDPRLDQQNLQYQAMGNSNRDMNAPMGSSMLYQDQYGGGRGGRHPMPPPHNYYDNPGGMLSSRGRGGIPPIQRPATADGMRGGVDRNGPPVKGRGYMGGARPHLIERSGTADPLRTRKPLKSPPISPDQHAWDSPFPTFPGTKKKTALTEEHEILEQMALIELGTAKESQSRGSNKRKDSQETISKSRASSKSEVDHYNNTSSRKQSTVEDNFRRGSDPRNMRRGQNQDVLGRGYSNSKQSAPERNVKMAIQNPIPVRKNQTIPVTDGNGFVGASGKVPGNMPLGRSLPPRPSSAAGNREVPRENFQARGPPMDYSMNPGPNNRNSLARNRSLGDLYGDYFQEENHNNSSSSDFEMPNFNNDSARSHRRGSSFEAHMQAPTYGANSYEEIKPLRLNQNMHGQEAQPVINDYQSAANNLQPYNEYYYGAPDEYGNIAQNQGFDPYLQTQGNFNEHYHGQNIQQPHSPNNLYLPPRTSSATPNTEMGARFDNNMGPNSQHHMNNFYGQFPDNSLPSHPMPAQSNLVTNTGIQHNNKPMPIRNYSGHGYDQQAPGTQSLETSSNITDLVSELENLRNVIKNNPADHATQMLLAKRLIDSGDVLVQSIPDQRARNKNREKYTLEAHRLLKKLVAQQNVEAMFFLADCYGRGVPGLEVDHKEAFSLYQSAAKSGHAAAAYRTAVCCELGNEEGGGTRKDPLKAIQWYKRAATLGDTPAMYKLGIVLLKGLLGQSRNPREAIGWLKRAAERADAENPHALHELALLYEQPQGSENSVIRDEAYAFQLFQQAAELGYKFSQFRLGCAYEYGLFNCPIDPKLSILWYSRAAAQEEHQSELALSGWYLTGSEGVLQQNDTEAYLWARKAAIAGLAKAEYAMGYFTEVGIGSPANLDDAKRWYWRAAAQNFPKARERLEDLKRGGNKAVLRPREKFS